LLFVTSGESKVFGLLVDRVELPVDGLALRFEPALPAGAPALPEPVPPLALAALDRAPPVAVTRLSMADAYPKLR
jgi:hypothetical protein